MPRSILPVGISWGPVYPGVGEPAQNFYIGRALGERKLDGDRYLIWWMAHGLREDAINEQCTRERLLERIGSETDIRHAGRIVERMLADEDLVEIDTKSGAQRKPFSELRLKPLGHGFGNNPENPIEKFIGRPGLENATIVPSEVQAVWELGLTDTTIWERCEWVAEDNKKEEKVDGRELFPTDPDLIAAIVAQFLPLMIAMDVAHLDDHIVGRGSENPLMG